MNTTSKGILEDYDLDASGAVDTNLERKLLLDDRRRQIIDADAKRDAQRQMTWAALSGMLVYPLVIVAASLLGLDKAASLLTDIASVYVVAASGVTAAYFGFSAIGTRNG